MTELVDVFAEPSRMGLQALANGIAQGIVLAAGVALVLRAFARMGAASRHVVWLATLMVVAALPVGGLVRGWPAASGVTSTTVVPGQGLPAQPWSISIAMGTWVPLVLGAIALVALARLARVGFALRDLRRLKRDSSRLPAAHHALLASHLEAFRFGRTATLRTSDQIRTPITVGFVRPTILIPPALLAELEPRELARLVLHEMAHVRRWDDWTNLAQRIVEAVFFFHPAVLWIGRRLDFERELACDDFAVAALPGERAYAQCLARLAELAAAARPPALAPGIAPRRSQLARRVGALLAPNRTVRSRVSLIECCGSAGAVAAAALAVASFAPVVAIASQAPRIPAPSTQARVDTVPAAVAVPVRVPAPPAPAAPQRAAKPARAPAVPRAEATPIMTAAPVELVPASIPLTPAPALAPAVVSAPAPEAPPVQPAPAPRPVPALRAPAPRLEVRVRVPTGSGDDAAATVAPLGPAGRYLVFPAPAAIMRGIGGGGGAPRPYSGLGRW